MTVKKGRRIFLTERELRNIEEKRRDGFVWVDIAEDYDCSLTTIRKRYYEWQNSETEFDKYLRMTWIEKIKYTFKEVFHN